LLRSLDLFTGYGGITLALKDWCKPIAYVEIEEYCQKIIAYRMADGSLPRARIFGDVKNIRGELGCADIIVGGFPCQDISVAGHGAGLEGKRSGLFFEIARLTEEIRPSFVFLENVPAIRTKGLWSVTNEFTEMGYDCRWTSVSASYVGASHRRERWFFLAHNRRKRGKGVGQKKIFRKQRLSWCEDERGIKDLYKRPDLYEPKLCRNLHDVAFGVDRIKALGNGVVPLQVKTAFEILMGLKELHAGEE